MAIRPPLSSHAARLATPAVGERIRATVRGRVPESDVADVMQGTYLRALVAPKLPEDLDELLRLVATIARGMVVDFHRASARRARTVADGAEPDQIAPEPASPSEREPAAVREMLEWVESEVERGHIAPEVVRWSRELATGATYEEIAAREGKSVSAVKVAIHRARKHLQQRWHAYAATTALGALLAIGIYAESRPTTHFAAPPVQMTAPTVLPAPAQPAVREPAADLREQAFASCAAGKWIECLRYFDEAKDRDPAGDAAPRVQAERARARDALEPSAPRTK